ncbi:hypothetical protein GCM10018782_13000 [Streptomyces griseoaurantiacus]|nr:hypothetical protein GCM10018782_13000 [Streptomyces griseoaurantiacus]
MSYGLINPVPDDWLRGFTRLAARMPKKCLAGALSADGGHFFGIGRRGEREKPLRCRTVDQGAPVHGVFH